MFVYDKRASTDTVWEMAQHHRADLVFVDHLRKWTMAGPPGSQAPGLHHLPHEGHDEAAQPARLHPGATQRGADADANSAPELKHLRDSGEIEEDADLCDDVAR